MRKMVMLLLVLLPVMGACSPKTVQSNEDCIQLRLGKVMKDGQPLNEGWHPLFLSNARCFDMTEQNFPDADNDENDVIQMEAQTRGPDVVTVRGDVSAVYQLTPGTALEVYERKGTEERLEAELFSAIREGYRSGIAQFSMADIFGPRRVEIGDTVQAHVERKIGRGGLINIRAIYVRNIKAPAQIEQARIAASQHQQLLEQTRTEFQIDSIEAMKTVVAAEASAERIRLEAQSYDNSPGLLRLREIEAMSTGLSQICEGVNNCIIGGTVLDRYLAGLGGN